MDWTWLRFTPGFAANNRRDHRTNTWVSDDLLWRPSLNIIPMCKVRATREFDFVHELGTGTGINTLNQACPAPEQITYQRYEENLLVPEPAIIVFSPCLPATSRSASQTFSGFLPTGLTQTSLQIRFVTTNNIRSTYFLIHAPRLLVDAPHLFRARNPKQHLENVLRGDIDAAPDIPSLPQPMARRISCSGCSSGPDPYEVHSGTTRKTVKGPEDMLVDLGVDQA